MAAEGMRWIDDLWIMYITEDCDIASNTATTFIKNRLDENFGSFTFKEEDPNILIGLDVFCNNMKYIVHPSNKNTHTFLHCSIPRLLHYNTNVTKQTYHGIIRGELCVCLAKSNHTIGVLQSVIIRLWEFAGVGVPYYILHTICQDLMPVDVLPSLQETLADIKRTFKRGDLQCAKVDYIVV